MGWGLVRGAQAGVLIALVFVRHATCQRSSGFRLAENGVTVVCGGPEVPVNSTGVVDGVTYTKRGREELEALVASKSWEALATSCTSDVQDFRELFKDETAFDAEIGSWDVAAAVTMVAMFRGASLFDRELGEWDTGGVTRMDDMFNGAKSFNQDIGRWNTGRVESMGGMFEHADAFDQDIGGWDTGRVRDMSKMFSGALSFNQPLMAWNTTSVTTMTCMFDSAVGFDGEVGEWNTGMVEDMSFMFQNAERFDRDIGGWDTGRVTTFNGMFQGAGSFNRDIGGWDTGNARDMSFMFSNAVAFCQDLDGWDVEGVTACDEFAGGTVAWGNPAGSPPLPAFSSCDPGSAGGVPDSTTATTQSSSSWSAGIIVGVVFGVVAGIVVVGMVLWCWMWKRRRDSSKVFDRLDLKSEEEEEEEGKGDVKMGESVADLAWHVSIHERLGSDASQTMSPFQAVAYDCGGQWREGGNAGLGKVAPGGFGASGGSSASGVPGAAMMNPSTVSEREARAVGISGLGGDERVQGRHRLDLVHTDPMTPDRGPRSNPFGYAGVGPLQRSTQNSVILSKSPSMSCLSLEQSPLTATLLDHAAAAQRTGSSLSRARSWDGWVQQLEDVDSVRDAEIIRMRRSEHTERPPTTPLLHLPAISEGSVHAIDMHIPMATIEQSLTKCIGVGGYGKVYKGVFRGEEVAVKRLPPDQGAKGSRSAYESLVNEIKLMSSFDSNRLVKVFGASVDDREGCCLIMELMRGGDLSKKIHDPRRRRLSYIQILQITQDIAEGLAYLHPLVAHRDLKPGNVLLDEMGRAKIGDFGISKCKGVDRTFLSNTATFNGTIMYMAPEQLNGGQVDEKVDVYSLGCIINEMVTRQYPWPSDDPRMMFHILRMVGIEGKRPWIDPDTPESLKRLITKCWAQDPRERPSCAEIVKMTEILIQEELRRLEDRTLSSSRNASTERLSVGQWSSVELSSADSTADHHHC